MDNKKSVLFIICVILAAIGGVILWMDTYPRSSKAGPEEEKSEAQLEQASVELPLSQQTLPSLHVEETPALKLCFPEPPTASQEQDSLLTTFNASEAAIASSEHFDIQVEYAAKRSRPGYVFKVTLQPRPEATFKAIRQNYFFLLDRSNSMPRGRYFLNKKAVCEAIALLHEGDRFNILIFDNHVVRFHDRAVDWSENSVEQVKAFLEGQGHGGYFAATDLYASLGKIIPQDLAEDEINTAILLSDGDTYLSPEKQRLMIGQWTTQNKGKVALYAVTSGEGNNDALLELLTSFNKGTVVHAQSHFNVSDCLANLVRTIQKPIGRQITVTAAVQDKASTVILQPKPARIPDLYQDRPFVLYGSTNRLSDFILFVQGHYYDQCFDISKKIVFNKATPAPPAVERDWTQLIAQEFYERYFEHGDTSYLESARQLLAPLNLPIPLLNKQ